MEITGLAAGGAGVARIEGRAVFVEGVVPGDLARVAVTWHGRFGRARLVALERPSPDRREPPCAIQARCGGCPWMALDEATQVGWKVRALADALERIGHLRGVAIEPAVVSPRALGYRNRIELTLGLDPEHGGPVLGYVDHERHPLDVPRCIVATGLVNAVFESVRAHLAAHRAAYAAALGASRAEPCRIVIRASNDEREALVVVREAASPLSILPELARHLMAAHPQLAGVVRLAARPGRRGGAHAEALVGRPWIHETVGGIHVRLPATSFVQVNAALADRLLALVCECAAAPDGARVLDLYGGVGLAAIALARAGARTSVCEADAAAVHAGREVAAEAGVGARVRFTQDDVGRFLSRAPRDIDVIVANPPRTGLGPGVTEALVGLRSSRIVVVSCDPPTLARDLARLVAGGYVIRRVVPVDQFPQTAHLEVVVRLDRAD